MFYTFACRFMTSAGVKLTFCRFCDVIPVFIRRVTVLSPSRLPSLSGANQLRHHSRNRPMPKKEKATKQSKTFRSFIQVKGPVAGSGLAVAGQSSSEAPDTSGSVIITVRVKPGAKRSSITEITSEEVGISVAAPPADGEANTELVRFLAEVLELKKSHISLDKGSRSRDKLIRVNSSLSPEEVLRRLRQAAG